MAENEQIIIDIEVSSQEAVQNILAARQAVAELTAKKKELADANELDAATEEQLTAQIRVQNDAIRANQKVLQDNIKQQQSLDGSLNSLRSQLRNLTKQYDSLSRTEREGAKGKELLNHIKEVTDEVKTAEAESGRFQRNVGNYPNVFNLAGGTMGKFAQMAQSMTAGTKTLGEGFKAAGQGVAGMGKQLLKLLANPIVALIAAIAAVVMQLVQAFKRNDDASTQMAAGLSALKPIITAVKEVFNALASVVGTVINVIGKAVGAVQSLIPAYKNAADAANDLVIATDRLEDVERAYTVEHAKREAQVSELRNKANDAEQYSFAQREKYLNDAIALEREDLRARVAIAKEKLRLATVEAKLNADTSDETKSKLAELQAAVYTAEKDYNDGIRRLSKQSQQFRADERKARADAAKQAAADRKERANKEVAEARALEDLLVEAMKEGEEKSKAEARIATQRRVQDLRKRLDEEKNLTVKARQDINEQIVLLEARLEIQLADIEKEYSRQRLSEMQQTQLEYWQARIATAKKGSEEEIEARQSYITAEVKAEREALLQRFNDGKLSEEQYDAMLAAVDKKGRDELAAIRKEEAQRAADDVALEWQNRINAAVEGSEERARLELEMRKEQLDNLHQMEEESDAEFLARQLKAQEDYTAAKAALDKVQQDTTKAKGEAIATITGNLSQLLEAAAGENKELANAAKILALGEVAVKQGVAIANGVASAMATPFPANIAAIATVVGSVLTVMTQAISTINSAQFATGGVIHGAGTGTSDSIVARVSNGESVINAKSTAKYYDLLSAINQDGGGVAFSGAVRNSFATGGMVNVDTLTAGVRSQEMARMMREAVADIHPVVSVREINSVQNRVKVKQEKLDK